MKLNLKSAIHWFHADFKAADNDTSDDIIDYARCFSLIFIHLGCLGLFWVGWSWTAVSIALFLYFTRMFAITAFLHRYFSHRTFKTNRFFQFIFAVIASSAMQRGALWWAAHHRKHHKESDTEKDVHSPHTKSFLWSHIGWITSRKNFLTDYTAIKDFARFPELVFLNRFNKLIPLLLGVLLFVSGEWLSLNAPSLNTNGWQLIIWGWFISTTALLHGTSTINSLSHLYGQRRFDTGDESRNNFWLSLITLGEGWHNNHHYYMHSARQGFYWWEIDITYYGLKIMSFIGIIHDLRPVPKHILDQGIRNSSSNEK
tara:strand:- start:140 stop:1081 length:942 start_codon:yes stop_codon:yes gene_type:complete